MEGEVPQRKADCLHQEKVKVLCIQTQEMELLGWSSVNAIFLETLQQISYKIIDHNND